MINEKQTNVSLCVTHDSINLPFFCILLLFLYLHKNE
jgi:hypothetical protein